MARGVKQFDDATEEKIALEALAAKNKADVSRKYKITYHQLMRIIRRQKKKKPKQVLHDSSVHSQYRPSPRGDGPPERLSRGLSQYKQRSGHENEVEHLRSQLQERDALIVHLTLENAKLKVNSD